MSTYTTAVIPRPLSMTLGKILVGSLHSSAMLTESSNPTSAKNASAVAADTAMRMFLSSGDSKTTTASQ